MRNDKSIWISFLILISSLFFISGCTTRRTGPENLRKADFGVREDDVTYLQRRVANYKSKGISEKDAEELARRDQRSRESGVPVDNP
jgi:hypothetical protein